MNRNLKHIWAGLLGAAALLPFACGAEPSAWPVGLHAAAKVAHAGQAGMLATAWAGKRIVAVGAHGVVLLSDDQGKQWRQAGKVPLDVTLTSVSFANDKEGWAVGHAGVVLHTSNGGEEWSVQRSQPEQDRPLFAVHFFDAQHGVAVGLWSLVLTTTDGGRHWTTRELEAPPGARRADLNLLGLFAGQGGALYAAAEKGYVLHSADQGLSWNYLPTGYKGSFWAGTALRDGGLLVGGLRGALYRSGDAGQSWTRVATGSTASITSVVRTGSGHDVLAVGQDGLVLRSADDGASVQGSYRTDRLPLSAALPLAGNTPPMMSARGPAPADQH
ncbi:WD40/YVTN/BNR-like repeat-containing protein [Duganella sp. S19_KUP01_CR8]|uniref:WD40/YVTN/BNR-like repeat-containing protein n=1 Tax=Duganella sp. S19_KUP01_CR8 TaxID=3025502 RepID=UPI002FCDC721